MPRRSIVVAWMIALLAVAAPAGELKIYTWPTQFVPQEVAAVPVVMDVGYWMQIVNQDTRIKLIQTGIRTYEGCVDLVIRTNFNLSLSASILATGTVPGLYSCSIVGADIDVPGGIATLCAKLRDPNLNGQPGGSKNVTVAIVTVKVAPRV